MLKTFRYRLYPNQTQQEQIGRITDACRFVYNWALETKKTSYETKGANLTWFDLNNRLKDLKQDCPFLKEVYSQSLQQAVKRVQLAFQHFFRRVKLGMNPVGYPQFKRRKMHRQSFDVPQFFTIDVAKSRVYLPKIGHIKTVFHRRFLGTPKMCTIVSTNTSKFYINIVVENRNPSPPKPAATNQTAVGIDLGVTTYITLSSGEKVANPCHLRNSLYRLQCLHRRLSHKQSGSRNHEKARRRLARFYERIANQRDDFQQKLSTRLIRENQAIMVESLNVRGMVRNRRLARAIADAAWSRFLEMLHYKSEWYGVTLVTVGRYSPTSKRCHGCGAINDALTLSDRTWSCPTCGLTLDRDVNAAKNIKLMGLLSIMSPREPRVGPVELSALAEASKQETPPLKAG